MEIRCSKCQHVGPAEVLPVADGVALVCENCGHHNQLTMSNRAPAAVDGAPSGPIQSPAQSVAAVAAPVADSPWLKEGALERLIPERGEGVRCRKCATLLADGEENCPRCGLNVEESERYPEGAAPWEQPPPSREAVHEQAMLIWKSLRENPTDDNLTKFVEFVREEQLLELGVRQLRFFLVDHPDSALAVRHLKELAASFQAKMIVAKAQAQVRADNFTLKSGRLKQIVLWIVFMLWGAIFIFFVANLANSCG